ncbi:MAG: hypothetical protein K0A92_01200 [Methyloprofundus sp.]|nr:hypothetical protein [Methyloprofundus sp.]
MWNCNFGPPFIHYGMVGMVINIMMLVAILYIVVLIVRALFSKTQPNRDTRDSLEIIRHKYASGQITEQEYLRMKEILTG